MNKTELYQLVQQQLSAFETADINNVSLDWDVTLLNKIDASKKKQSSVLVRISIAVCVTLITINTVFILISLKSKTSIENKKELRLISSELLINETI